MNVAAFTPMDVLEIGTISVILSGVFWNAVAAGTGVGERSVLLVVAATAVLVTVFLLYVELTNSAVRRRL